MTVRMVGLDLAKDVFQVRGISENGRVIFNKAINRIDELMPWVWTEGAGCQSAGK